MKRNARKGKNDASNTRSTTGGNERQREGNYREVQALLVAPRASPINDRRRPKVALKFFFYLLMLLLLQLFILIYIYLSYMFYLSFPFFILCHNPLSNSRGLMVIK